MFLCETVITDRDTHNLSLINCFKTRRLREVPGDLPACVFCALLTNGSGTIQMETVVTHLPSAEELTRHTTAVTFRDPTDEIRYLLRMPRLWVTAPGEYEFVLAASGEIIGRVVLTVIGPEGEP